MPKSKKKGSKSLFHGYIRKLRSGPRLCYSCSKGPADSIGPDGLHTLCLGCFDKYNNRELQLFRKISGEVSARRKHCQYKVTRYEFFNDKPGTPYSLMFTCLNPVVKDFEELEDCLYQPMPYYRHISFAGAKKTKVRNRQKGQDKPPPSSTEGAQQVGQPSGVDTPDGAFVNTMRNTANDSGAMAGTQNVGENIDGAGAASQSAEETRTRTSSGNAPASSSGNHTMRKSDLETDMNISTDTIPERSYNSATGSGAGTNLNNPVENLSNPSAPGSGIPPAANMCSSAMMNRVAEYLRSRRSVPDGTSDAQGRGDERPESYSVKVCITTPTTGPTITRFKMEQTTFFSDFVEHLKDSLELEGNLRVTYIDDEGDEIIITNDNELSELFTVARRHSISPVRMNVVVGGS